MNRPVALLTAALFLTTSAIADPVNLTERDGSPAVETSGSSSTTISVIGGAASVSVQGGGSLNVYTNSGTVTGTGTLGVPELGLSVGGGLGVVSADNPDIEALAALPGATLMQSEQGNSYCVDPDSYQVDADDVALVVDANQVIVVSACNGGNINEAFVELVSTSTVLRGALAQRGLAADDVVGGGPADGGRFVLVVSTAR